MTFKLRHTFILLLLCLVFINFVHGEEGCEIQFGAFLIRGNAEQLKADLEPTTPGVYVTPIQSQDGRLLFAVRTGPFANLEDAREKLGTIPQMTGFPPAMIMEQGSFNKAFKAAATLDPEENSQVPVKSGEEKTDFAGDTESGDVKQKDNSATRSMEKEPVQTADSTETEPGADDGEEPLWGSAQEDASWDDSGNENETVEAAWEGEESSAGETDPASSPGMKALESEIETLKGQVKSLLDAEEIRGELTETETEKESRDEEILDTAGRNYTLMKKGGIGFEYKLDYTYNSYDTITEIDVIDHNSNHTIINTFTLEYPLKDNLTLEAAIPFVYEYDAVGRSDSKNVTDFGDVRFGASFQPIKSGGKIPSIILNTTLTCPMGRSPYEVNPDLDLSTGSGGYSLEGSLSLSKAVDPIMAFGTLSYNYRFPIKNLDYKIGSYTLERYDRGDSIGLSVGLGYSVSYLTSVTFGYSYSYSFKSRRYYKEAPVQEYATQTSSSLSIGSSWRLSEKLRVNLSLGIGLGNSDYFSLSCRVPMEFGRD